MPELDSKKAPYLNAHWVSGVLYIAQHGGDGHDGQADPEEVEEAMEVTVVAVGIEVGNSTGELDGGEETSALLCANLLTGGRERLDGLRSIWGYWC